MFSWVKFKLKELLICALIINRKRADVLVSVPRGVTAQKKNYSNNSHGHLHSNEKKNRVQIGKKK